MLETGRRIIIDASYPSRQREWYGNGEIDPDDNLILPAGTTQQTHDAIREQMQAGQVSGQVNMTGELRTFELVWRLEDPEK
jgi:hypothetical protein